ncbi:6-bladed beta-propeller [Litoribacter alkaliphilus]|uniref:6-bladed beta-propeller n=1 Tax=Litoribacter ruber TaxID=702568 RepID=A0AAP2CLD5_9BACT|nr:6-bladed beta-propeller [Litoribacter alkaliphilus]MBS9523977.1 6-bladed beta-propeller [Litoribacter alkaliphilus]
MKKFLIGTTVLVVLINVFISCSGKDLEINLNLSELIIDYSSAAKNLHFSDIVTEEIVVIPLSNTDVEGNYFYMTSIDVLEKRDGNFFLFDIFGDGEPRVFDESGSFVRKIGSRGNGLGQYLQAMDFGLLEDKIEVLDVGKIHSYELDGTFVSSRKFSGFMASRFHKLDNGYAFIGAGPHENNLHLTDSSLNLVSSHFPYLARPLNAMLLNPLSTNANNQVIYRRSLNDTLFAVNNLDYPEPYLKVQYGNRAPNVYEWLGEKDEVMMSEIAKSANTLYFFESEGYRFLSFFLDGEKWNNIYSNYTGESVIFKNSDLIDDVTLDPSSYLIGVSGETFYFLSKPESFKQNFSENLLQKHHDKHIQKIKGISENLDIEGNPVLVGVKFNF